MRNPSKLTSCKMIKILWRNFWTKFEKKNYNSKTSWRKYNRLSTSFRIIKPSYLLSKLLYNKKKRRLIVTRGPNWIFLRSALLIKSFKISSIEWLKRISSRKSFLLLFRNNWSSSNSYRRLIGTYSRKAWPFRTL